MILLVHLTVPLVIQSLTQRKTLSASRNCIMIAEQRSNEIIIIKHTYLSTITYHCIKHHMAVVTGD